MAIDLQYLYWLQGLREASGNIFTPFMTWVSDFATNGVILVPAFVFWCIHKRSGTFLLLSMGISKFINGVAKLTVCATVVGEAEKNGLALSCVGELTKTVAIELITVGVCVLEFAVVPLIGEELNLE